MSESVRKTGAAGHRTKLSGKQKLFCYEYVVDLNATQAAIRAGYSKEFASDRGCKELKKPLVAALIQELMEERMEKTKIDASWLLTRLAQEVNADLADIYNRDGTVKAIHDWPLIWRQGLVSGVDMTTVDDEVVLDNLRISNRVTQLTLIGKHVDVRAFEEVQRHEHGDSLVEYMEAAAKRLDELRVPPSPGVIPDIIDGEVVAENTSAADLQALPVLEEVEE